jgi:hypothetical protein
MAVSRDDLFRARLNTKDVDVPGLGTVRVRALSRGEVLELKKMEDLEQIERTIIATAMVDPALSMDDVAQWAAVSPASEIELVSEEIARLSGLDKGAERAAVSTFPERTGDPK